MRRIAHALVTHPWAVLGTDDQGEQHLQAGHLYALDATVRHWCRNPSPVDRIHLLFAYFPHTGMETFRRWWDAQNTQASC